MSDCYIIKPLFCTTKHNWISRDYGSECTSSINLQLYSVRVIITSNKCREYSCSNSTFIGISCWCHTSLQCECIVSCLNQCVLSTTIECVPESIQGHQMRITFSKSCMQERSMKYRTNSTHLAS